MSTYYIHDGRNEVGPFTIEVLKKQKLTRSTPIRQMGTDNWMPAEKLAPLKEIVVPRKIRKPEDIVPGVKERIVYLKERKPVVLYAMLLLIALIGAISIYSVAIKRENKPVLMAATTPGPLPSQSSLTTRSEIAVPESSRPKEELKAPVITESKEKTARQHWNKLISATNSNYGIGLLGGIKDLSVIVSNRTDYPIDLAVVKVTYIKANGSVWKTVPITVYGVPAHDATEQAVPDAGRGKKVKVSIQKLVSKKMKFSYTEGQKGRNPDDPYVL